MDFANRILSQYGLIAGVIAAFVAVLVGWLFFWKGNLRLTLAILGVVVLVGLIVLFEVVLPRRFPDVDPGLPIFARHIWTWMLGFSLAALAAGVEVVRLWRRRRGATPAEAPGGRFPDLDAAWEAIRLRFGQAGIVPGAQKVYLLLGPDEEWAAAQVRAAGLQPFAQGPDTPSPIHAYALAEGILLSCAGACGLGRQDAEGPARLEDLGRKLRAANPDRPILGGVVLLLPAEWASQADAARCAAAARDDLQAIRRTFRIRPPVFAVLPQMEALPGLAEFVARLPEAMRQNRCGFAVPSTRPFSGELVQNGLTWLSGWFDTWTLSQMADVPLDPAGNGRLFCLDHEVRRRRRRWRGVVEAALSTHRDAEPVLFRGLYCTATGPDPDLQAFSAGLFRGARSRVLADHVAAEWSDEARADDRSYRRAALAVGLVGGLMALVTWSYIVRLHPSWWFGFLAVIAVWIAMGIRLAMK